MVMDSLMRLNNEKVVTIIKTSNETPKLMAKIILKMIIDTYFEYTDDENDVVWLDSIKTLIVSCLEKHKIGLDSNRLEDYILEILKNNNTIIIGDFFKKIKHRKLMQANQRLSLPRPEFTEEEITKINEAGIDRVYCKYQKA